MKRICKNYELRGTGKYCPIKGMFTENTVECSHFKMKTNEPHTPTQEELEDLFTDK